MANNISREAADTIERMTRQSYTLRQITSVTGIHRMTILRHQELRGLTNLLCACGKSIKHRGFCHVRLSRSLGRQEWMRTWHPKSLNEIALAFDTSDVCYFGS